MSNVTTNSTEPVKSVLEEQSLEKWVPVIKNETDLLDAVDKAVDYRGDITIALKDGGTKVGYVFNRDVKCATPFVEIFPADKDEKVRILLKDIASLAFTGIDTAAGKSWAVWMAKYKAKESQEAGA